MRAVRQYVSQFAAVDIMSDLPPEKALLYDEYYVALPVFIFTSLAGFAMIAKAARRETSYLNGALHLPVPAQLLIGALLQGPFLGYLWLGYRAGAF